MVILKIQDVSCNLNISKTVLLWWKRPCEHTILTDYGKCYSLMVETLVEHTVALKLIHHLQKMLDLLYKIRYLLETFTK
jgi:hypothetical protein